MTEVKRTPPWELGVTHWSARMKTSHVSAANKIQRGPTERWNLYSLPLQSHISDFPGVLSAAIAHPRLNAALMQGGKKKKKTRKTVQLNLFKDKINVWVVGKTRLSPPRRLTQTTFKYNSTKIRSPRFPSYLPVLLANFSHRQKDRNLRRDTNTWPCFQEHLCTSRILC